MDNNTNTPVDDLRVIIIDDCPILRKGFCTMLQEAGFCKNCVEHLDPSAALAFLHNHPWNLVVLGAPLSGHSWLHLLKDIAHTRPSAYVLIFSDLHGPKHEISAVRAGASGYIHKSCSPELITTAVKNVIDGKNFVSQDLIHALVDQLNAPRPRKPEEFLSEREFQVLRGLTQGKSTKELASELHLSSKTVSTYRARICAKLGVNSNAGLVRYALKHKLLA